MDNSWAHGILVALQTIESSVVEAFETPVFIHGIKQQERSNDRIELTSVQGIDQLKQRLPIAESVGATALREKNTVYRDCSLRSSTF
jgi:hypothetical protein